MARLQIEFGGTRTVVALKGRETTFGRSNRCTVHLPDPELAGIHFRIQQKARGYRLKDDGSGAGTRVNGKVVFATTLKHGDVIEAGQLRCVFLAEGEEIPVAGAAESASEPELPRGASRKTTPARLAVLTAVGVIALGVVAYLLFVTPASEKAHALWNRAREVLDEARESPQEAREKLAQAAGMLETIEHEYGKTRIAGTAAVKLREVRRTLKAFDRVDAERRILEAGLEWGADMEYRARLRQIQRVGHPAIDSAVERLEQELDEALRQKLETLYANAERESREHIVKERYAEALRTWSELEVSDYATTKRIEAARQETEKRIFSEYRARLRLAGRNTDLDARIGLLEACRPVFRGTRHAEDLEVRISALRARRAQAAIVVLKKKKTPVQPKEGPAKATPETPPEKLPYVEPPKVAELVKARRYAEAASTLNSISRHPDAKVRAEELTLLAGVMADLVAAIQAEPGRFTQILLPNHVGRGDAVGADARLLHIRKDGKQTRYAWEDMPAKSFVRLFRQAGFDNPARLGTAIFFDEEELPKDAQRAYTAFFRSEQAPTTLTRILARRRGIEPPKGGFLLFRGQLVTESERDGILLRERIDKLGVQARSKNDRRRLEAWKELESLGEPALETLLVAVRARQAQAVEELKASRAFTPQRFAAKFGAELQRRRQHALAFILDAKAYPYPNKSAEAQKEAEKRVDAVRELYEKPFAKLLEASEPAQLLDKEVRGLDDMLARLDPLSEPMHETAVEEITRKLDMRTVAVDERDRKRIDYNLSIERYNRELKGTSADSEERANVTAVNEYRWMMGLHSLKIDERLVRAARKHSIEMQQLNYFAHDSPTSHLKNPTLRARREGYGAGVSENIARGASTGRGAFWQWFRSSGHHRNMVLGHTEMGCGSAAHHWWTQNFGRLTGKSLNPPSIPADPDPPGQSGNGMPAPGSDGDSGS